MHYTYQYFFAKLPNHFPSLPCDFRVPFLNLEGLVLIVYLTYFSPHSWLIQKDKKKKNFHGQMVFKGGKIT